MQVCPRFVPVTAPSKSNSLLHHTALFRVSSNRLQQTHYFHPSSWWTWIFQTGLCAEYLLQRAGCNICRIHVHTLATHSLPLIVSRHSNDVRTLTLPPIYEHTGTHIHASICCSYFQFVSSFVDRTRKRSFPSRCKMCEDSVFQIVTVLLPCLASVCPQNAQCSKKIMPLSCMRLHINALYHVIDSLGW